MKSLFMQLLGMATVLILIGNCASVYAAVAGRVQYVHGKVQLTTATGVTHAIKKGEAVSEGDTLISSPSAFAQIRMEDGGMVVMRSDTKLKIDRFVFDGQEDGTERSFYSVFKGGFRAITGRIGKKNKVNYRITTPATTIGIRGTDHETFVVTPDSALAAETPVGTYNKVNLGETSMTTDKGTIYVMPNQMGFVGARDQMPELQPVNLNIFTVTGRPSAQGNVGERQMGNPEGDVKMGETSKNDKREMRETSTTDKNEMRDTAIVDKIRVRESSNVEHAETGGAISLTPSTEGGGTSTIPTTPNEMLEQEH
jgi:hypothetical protein